MTNVQPEFSHVALFTSQPARLPGLVASLRQFAGGEGRKLLLWANAERFRAPPGLHPPYHALGRIEARNLTADRVAAAETATAEASATLAAEGWEVTSEILLDATSADVLSRLDANQIELLVTESASFAGQAERLAAKAGCALLLVPDSEHATTGASAGGRANQAGRLSRVLHG
ncbi:MAG: hypothetical protein GEU75_08960 [Dehalococcoidia bacterium]|nr:hypothetical protein [Dehalococcoidia bacterium]